MTYGWLLAGAGTAVLTAALAAASQPVALTYEAMLFLALAVMCALVGGRWPAIAASVLGATALNYYFTAPVRTLAVEDASNLVTLGVFVLVSLSVASVVDVAARRGHQAALARDEANTLAMLNRTVLGGEYTVLQLLDLVRRTFGAGSAELLPSEADVAPGDTVAPAGPETSLVLRGVSLPPSEHRVLAAFATHLGVLEERAELVRQTEAAHLLSAGNRARTALLAAVSHDLRTPLAGIRTAAETLRRNDLRLPPADRADLLRAIEESTTRLTAMIADLLDMSRLHTGAVQPVFADVALDDIVQRAMIGLPATDRVAVCGPLPAVRADIGLLERALANLISNALRHTDGLIQIHAEPLGDRVRLAVVDHGPGIPETRRAGLFEPFQRQGDSTNDGAGLGLAVARGLVEAQGGQLIAGNTPTGGLTMVIDVPQASS